MTTASAIQTMKTALFGSPPTADHKPSRDGVFAAFVEQSENINVSGTTLVFSTVALLNAHSTVGLAVSSRAEVRADPAGDVVNKNGVWSWSGTVWTWISPLLPSNVAPADALDRLENLHNALWLDEGVLTGDLTLGTGWTTKNTKLAKAIKDYVVTGDDPTEHYYLGIFQNNVGDDIIAIYRSSDSALVASVTATITKSSTGPTKLIIPPAPGRTEQFSLWIDYRDIDGETGSLQNSNSEGPLWFARSTSQTPQNARLSAIEENTQTLRNNAVNGSFDPSGKEPVIAGLIPGQSLPYVTPHADMLAAGVIRSISIGPEATQLVFFYKDEPIDASFANKYFAASCYIYCSDVANFPAVISGLPIAGESILASAVTASGFVQISTNVRRYWITGQLPNNLGITAFRYGAGSKCLSLASTGGFTFRSSPTSISINDVRMNDWLGEYADESAIARLQKDYASGGNFTSMWTPYIKSSGELNIIGSTAPDGKLASDAQIITIAKNTGTIRGVVQNSTAIYWFDDGIISRQKFNFQGFAALQGLGATKIVFKPMLGQSLSIGTSSTSIITTTSPRPNRVFMFNGGTRITQGNTFDNLSVRDLDDVQMQSLVPLFEKLPPNGLNFGETQGGGEAWWLGAPGKMAANEVFVFASFGFGGLTIASLLPGTVPYRNLLRGVRRLKALCDLNGMTLEVPAVDFDQGQANYGDSAVSYQASLTTLQAGLTTDINAILGTSGQIPLMLRQATSWTVDADGYRMTQSLAMLGLVDHALANPTKFRLAGPQYSIDGYAGDGVHMLATGSRREGEYRGRSTERLRSAAASEGLVMTAVSNSGTAITITFNALTQIAIDTTLVSNPGQNGLRLVAPDGVTTIALSGIAPSGTNMIVATAASALTAGQTYTMGVADIGTINQPAGPTTGPRSNIRDSSADAASSGANLYNWAHCQRKTFVAS